MRWHDFGSSASSQNTRHSLSEATAAVELLVEMVVCLPRRRRRRSEVEKKLVAARGSRLPWRTWSSQIARNQARRPTDGASERADSTTSRFLSRSWESSIIAICCLFFLLSARVSPRRYIYATGRSRTRRLFTSFVLVRCFRQSGSKFFLLKKIFDPLKFLENFNRININRGAIAFALASRSLIRL